MIAMDIRIALVCFVAGAVCQSLTDFSHQIVISNGKMAEDLGSGPVIYFSTDSSQIARIVVRNSNTPDVVIRYVTNPRLSNEIKSESGTIVVILQSNPTNARPEIPPLVYRQIEDSRTNYSPPNHQPQEADSRGTFSHSDQAPTNQIPRAYHDLNSPAVAPVPVVVPSTARPRITTTTTAATATKPSSKTRETTSGTDENGNEPVAPRRQPVGKDAVPSWPKTSTANRPSGNQHEMEEIIPPPGRRVAWASETGVSERVRLPSNPKRAASQSRSQSYISKANDSSDGKANDSGFVGFLGSWIDSESRFGTTPEELSKRFKEDVFLVKMFGGSGARAWQSKASPDKTMFHDIPVKGKNEN